MSYKKMFLIVLVCIIVLPLLGDVLNRQIALDDTMGITVGMPVEDFHKEIPDGELLLVEQYGFFVNDMGYPVGVRCDETSVVEIKVFDIAKLDRSVEGFERLKPGMTILQLGQIVGVPAAIASEEGPALYYLCSGDVSYMLTFEQSEGKLIFVESETVKAEKD